MRSFINNVSASLLSSVAFAPETETGSTLSAEQQAAIIAASETATAKAIGVAPSDLDAMRVAGNGKPVATPEQIAAKRTAKAAKLISGKPAKPAKASSAKPAKPVAAKPGKAGKAATVTAPDASAAKRERIASERATVYGLYVKLQAVASVPVKPLSAFKPLPAKPHSIARGATPRQAAAIALAVASTGKKLSGKNAVTFPRIFNVNGIASCIENGCVSDMLASKLATLTSGSTPETERFTLSAKAAASVIGMLGSRALAGHVE